MNIYGYNIEIENQPAVFGDGQHETTRFLLYFLNRYVEGKTYLDAGCGTGILSIFAAKKGARSVTAVDMDVMAAETTGRNMETNGISGVQILNADIESIEEQVDIITANFAREEAIERLTKLKKITTEGGLLITTWYDPLPEINTDGFTIEDRIEGMEYDCYVLRRTTQWQKQ